MGLRHSVPIHTHFGGCATTRSFVCVCVEDRNAWSFGHSPTLRPCKDHLAVQIGLFGVNIGLCCGHTGLFWAQPYFEAVQRSFGSTNRSLWRVYRALLRAYRAMLSVRRACLILCWLFGEKVGLF